MKHTDLEIQQILRQQAIEDKENAKMVKAYLVEHGLYDQNKPEKAKEARRFSNPQGTVLFVVWKLSKYYDTFYIKDGHLEKIERETCCEHCLKCPLVHTNVQSRLEWPGRKFEHVPQGIISYFA